MPELDQIWAQMLARAQTGAVAAGRDHVAEYLRLKASNDAIRRTGVSWLLDTFIDIATSLRVPHVPLIDREEPHSFSLGSSNMVGTRLNIRHGVRCLSVEAGWARSPSDGIMTGGSLAHACISHFGIPRENRELRLVHADTLPQWISDDGSVVITGDLQRHFELLFG
ncbi:MAG: hypothetical protein ABIV21_09290 [Pyrinomonadaceae bacterium]